MHNIDLTASFWKIKFEPDSTRYTAFPHKIIYSILLKETKLFIVDD